MNFTGVPVVSIDENFAKNALLENDHIVLLATAGVAATSVSHTFERYQRVLRRYSQVETVIVSDTAGLSGDDFNAKIWETAKTYESTADAFVLAQPSMAFAADYLRSHTGKKVYSAVDNPFSILSEICNYNV